MRRIATFVALLAAAGCIPDHEGRPSVIDEARVIAVRGEPAEAEPESEIAFALLVAGPDGTLGDPEARWSFCREPRAPGETGPASSACAEQAGTAFGSGPTAAAPLPEDGCSIHGPDTPPGELRPRDPDATGGYYQPVRIDLDGAVAFGAERIACHLANAPIELAIRFRDEYVANRNPSLAPLDWPAAVSAGDEVELAVDWPGGDAEGYLYFDPISHELVNRRESMSVSWFANAGRFESDRTGRAEEDEASGSSNRWTAPDDSGPVHLWVVLRDSRGGTAWAEGVLEVSE